MNRREFLKQGVAVGAASAAASGCATGGPGAAPQAPGALPDMDEYLARVDADLESLERLRIGPQVAAVLGLEDGRAVEARIQRDQALVRKAAKTLYLTSAFRDLPEEGRAHPGMQRRMWEAAPDMSAAVEGMRQRLAALPAPERARIQRGLKARPQLMDSVCQLLDSQVSLAWVQPERRVRQRMVMNSLGWRMQHQSVAAVIEQYVEKVDRARPRGGGVAELERRLMAQVGQEAFWASRDRMVAAARRWEEQRAGLGGGAGEFEAVPPDEQVMNTGLLMMGIGLATGLGGVLLLMVGYSSPLFTVGMIGTTVGGALLLIGLLTWIVGLAMDAAEAEEIRERHPATPGPPADGPPI